LAGKDWSAIFPLLPLSADRSPSPAKIRQQFFLSRLLLLTTLLHQQRFVSN